jgi:GGDEF domain-containing protein
MVVKIRDNVKLFNSTINYGFELSLGIGYAVYPSQDITDVNSLLKAADASMYRNKKMMKSKAEQEVRK